MVGQSSSKVEPMWQKQEVVTSAQTGTYTVTTGWVDAGNGFSVTIPRDGYYIVRATGTVRIEHTANNQCGCYLRLYDGAAEINNTPKYYDKWGTAGEDIEVRIPFHIECQYQYFSGGTVITLQAQKTNTDTVSIEYSAGISEGYIEAILQNGVALTIPTDRVYDTSETNTGKVWIDGKPIYRKVVNCGALPDTTTKNIAHGITTIDNVVGHAAWAKSTGNSRIPLPYSHSNDIYNMRLLITNTNIEIETFAAWSTYTSCYVVLEYTKV